MYLQYLDPVNTHAQNIRVCQVFQHCITTKQAAHPMRGRSHVAQSRRRRLPALGGSFCPRVTVSETNDAR